ncbi:MAG: Integrase [Caulobacteraceae bacterium]|nr:Integrase [Caulobacteraceae bacterium]
MATLKLTDGLVENIEPEERDTYIWDAALPRFGVRVTCTGARLYLVQYRAKGAPGEPAKTRRITIGQHDGDLWNATKARAAARKLLAPVDLGRDPFAERGAERRERHQAEAAAAASHRLEQLKLQDNFKAVAERYIALCMKSNRSGAETARLLRHGPIPVWADRHIAEVRRADVADLIDTIKKRSPAVARATYAALRGVFGWCLERDLIETSPCDHLTAPPRPEARDRVIADADLAPIWTASTGLGFPFGPVVKLLMLTGQRRAEVGGMRWEEVDLDAGTWRIPKERTKNGKAHEIDLSPQAVKILKELTKAGGFVFPARGEGAVRGFSATKRKLDGLIEAERRRADKTVNADLQPWRLHDLRRTAATGMAAMGFPPHVVERVLNHISGTQSGLVGVYQRHEYRAERKAAMFAWGAHVDALISGVPAPSNVHPIRGETNAG